MAGVVVQNVEISKHLHDWRLTRRELKAAKATLYTTGDVAVAEKLLRHSIAYGHSRLVIRRYLLARALGAINLDLYNTHFSDAIQILSAAEVDKANDQAVRLALTILSRNAR